MNIVKYRKPGRVTVFRKVVQGRAIYRESPDLSLAATDRYMLALGYARRNGGAA